LDAISAKTIKIEQYLLTLQATAKNVGIVFRDSIVCSLHQTWRRCSVKQTQGFSLSAKSANQIGCFGGLSTYGHLAAGPHLDLLCEACNAPTYLLAGFQGLQHGKEAGNDGKMGYSWGYRIGSERAGHWGTGGWRGNRKGGKTKTGQNEKGDLAPLE